MQATAGRLVELRHSINLSQMKLSKILGLSQPAVNRYEHDQSIISDEVLLLYADYFDVSLDYICGRTDKPEGTIFSACPKIGEDNAELRQFIEFCFDPTTKMSQRLKETLYEMMTAGGEPKK